jgi:hypothetical protein
VPDAGGTGCHAVGVQDALYRSDVGYS